MQYKYNLLFITLIIHTNLSSFTWHTQVQKKHIYQTITINDLSTFAQLYKKRPIKNNGGGMKSVGMFWVWFITKTIQPDLIVESGIWLGQSTWLLERAAPKAKIIAIDINLDRIKYRSPRVSYTSTDFSQLDFGDISTKNTLCFFDDHQNAFNRLKQAKEKGFKHIIFDDNYPPDAGGHLTLARCLAWYPKSANYINSIINYYTIFPNITDGYTRTSKDVYKTEQLDIIVPKHLSLYKKDAQSYRWTTYLSIE